MSVEGLAGRVAAVTGASRGIGRACALALADAGATVAALGRSAAALDGLVAEIGQRGGRALALTADVSDVAAVETAFAKLATELGPVEVLINNAATLGPPEELVLADPAAWFATYRTNVLGCMLCAQAVLPGMIEQRRGKIVNVSSGAALAPIAGYSAYSSSKAALLHLSVCLAEEVKRYGINVNAVGVWAHTAMWDDQLANQPMPAVEQAHSSGWRPTPEENVSAILFLASPAADHVTGQYLATNSLPDYLRQA